MASTVKIPLLDQGHDPPVYCMRKLYVILSLEEPDYVAFCLVPGVLFLREGPGVPEAGVLPYRTSYRSPETLSASMGHFGVFCPSRTLGPHKSQGQDSAKFYGPLLVSTSPACHPPCLSVST